MSLLFLLCQADRRIIVCHLVGLGCGMTRPCVLGANARMIASMSEYDNKGNGLVCLVGHTPIVGRHEAMCNMPRQRPAPGFLSTQPAAAACTSHRTHVRQRKYHACFFVCLMTLVAPILVRIMFCCVLLYQADRRIVVCHLVGPGSRMTRRCVLAAMLGFRPSMTARAMG